MLLRILPLTALAFSVAAQAQQAFEVASIKPNSTDDNRVMIRMAPGGRFTATGVTLRQLISQAYNVRDFQITGGPGWIGDERYDINAKGPDGMPDRVPPEVLRPMLRALIEERFQLKTHKESKELPVFALVVGKGGPKLAASTEGQGPMMRMGRGQLNGKKIPMNMLAQQLAQQIGRNVINKTGLEGEYDINLEWTPEPGQGGGPFGGHAPAGAGGEQQLPAADSTGPTIFTAVQEQLGLRLESEKGPVETIVIDSVAKPTGN
jgi:bla regulator protein blaR1